MYEFLEGFHQRMQLIGVVDALINRRNKKLELEHPIGDKEFENLIFSVLVFIMEKTLTEEEECTIKTISVFVEHVLEEYYHYPKAKDQALPVTEYIIKTILQFEGKNTYYPVMNYETKEWTELRIKLLNEKVEDRPQGYVSVYSLTDQGYDFLFRTKEVDNEISFSVEEFKLRELIKRKNYRKALQQSSNLVQMVRQKKRDLEQFIQAARGNIMDLDLTKFDELISSTYKLLQEEYKTLGEIQNMVRRSEGRIREDYEKRGELTDDLRKAQMEMKRIVSNLALARKEQAHLINSREGSYKILKSTLEESFQFSTQRRYDFEKEILKPMERIEEERTKDLWKIFTPLFHVEPYRHLPLSLFYKPQGKLSEEASEDPVGILVEEVKEDVEKERNEKRSEVYLNILKSMVEEAEKREGTLDFKTFCEVLQKNPEEFQDLTKENLLFITMLKLYEMETLDVKAFRESDKTFLGNPTGEFNVDALLYQLIYRGSAFESIDKIQFQKIEEESFTILLEEKTDAVLYRRTIEVDNISIKVVKKYGTY
ncbi:hypothetical protein [Proteiniclasticum ruminis]|uniref:Replicative DNA helicase n=1 Tax=Proteiniclasticum ruminis TaxID=398199 RepID=A0A1G8SIM8_9CLOT|nr:hypothetical protein [Proteiniclasticum ruminis]SDJ29014.1 hypothetical protein SAMN05421804_11234 [Proteiniclasticum ruminis]